MSIIVTISQGHCEDTSIITRYVNGVRSWTMHIYSIDTQFWIDKLNETL